MSLQGRARVELEKQLATFVGVVSLELTDLSPMSNGLDPVSEPN